MRKKERNPKKQKNVSIANKTKSVNKNPNVETVEKIKAKPQLNIKLSKNDMAYYYEWVNESQKFLESKKL
jgi:Zn-dependent metalloprotease